MPVEAPYDRRDDGVLPGHARRLPLSKRGACCTAGWAIPAEPAVVHAVQARFRAAGRLFVTRPRRPTNRPSLRRRPAAPACSSTRRTIASARFIETSEPSICPSACRHFPRVVLTDDRGTFISLSHFCPTAAAMLFSERPIRRVAAPASLSLDERRRGTGRARRPAAADRGRDVDRSRGLRRVGTRRPRACCVVTISLRIRRLESIDDATRDIEAWRPGTEALTMRVQRAFENAEISGRHCAGLRGCRAAAQRSA